MSNVKRVVNLNMVNGTSASAVTSNTGEESGDPLLSPSSPHTIASGGSQMFSGSSTTRAVQGVLQLYDPDNTATGASVWARYCASSSSSNTKVTVSARAPSLGLLSNLQQQGSSLYAFVTMYNGLPQSGEAGVAPFIISLGPDPMSLAANITYIFHDLVDQMFDPDVRSAGTIEALIDAAAGDIADDMSATTPPVVHYVDFTGGQIATMVEMWAGYWINGMATAPCPAPDAALIDLLSTFLIQANSTLWIPQLKFLNYMDTSTKKEATTGAALFLLEGYRTIELRMPSDLPDAGDVWSEDGVRAFLTLLASGGHMATICSELDLGDAYDVKYDFYNSFKNSPLLYHEDPGNSHYADGMNTSGSYYIPISGDFTPQYVEYLQSQTSASTPIGLIDAFMTCKTDQWASTGGGGYTAVMQLEGWQAYGMFGGARHGADFDAYKQTYWNISTFGCSPYSEKRATTVFLAPSGWTPVVTQETFMMPYLGAYATKDGDAQGWMQSYLVNIPSDAVPYNDTLYPPQ